LEKNQVIILIPSHNEIETLKKICLYIKKLRFKILVIDDHSNDETSHWLRKNSFNFIKNKKRMGYEKSILIGMKFIIKKLKVKYLLTFDADGEHRVTDLAKLINGIKRQNADMIIGNRNKFNRWSEYILSFFYFIRFGIKDPISGFKIYSIQKLGFFKNKIKSNSYLVDLVVKFKKKKFIVKNQSIIINNRMHGISKNGNNMLINLKILKLIKYIFFYKL
jgi:hypothetical protein